jgi:hypothetical protein
VADRVLRALVQRHQYVAAERELDIHGRLRRERVDVTIEVGVEDDTLFGNLANPRQAEHLKPAGISENRARPGHEPVQSAETADQLVPGTQIKVICVAQKNAYVEILGQVALRQSFDRSLSADGHEHRRLDIAVGRMQHAGARARDRALRLDLEGDLRHESGVAAAVLMVGGNSADQVQCPDNLSQHGFDTFKSLLYFALHGRIISLVPFPNSFVPRWEPTNFLMVSEAVPRSWKWIRTDGRGQDGRVWCTEPDRAVLLGSMERSGCCCSVFNYAIRFEKYDKNPVSVVAQEKEPPGRDRFPEPEEIVSVIRVCEEKGDLELKAFLILAPTTGMRKGEILAWKWSDVDLDSRNPSIYVRIIKNDEPKRIQLPDIANDALRALPSYRHREYVFPASDGLRRRPGLRACGFTICATLLHQR